MSEKRYIDGKALRRWVFNVAAVLLAPGVLLAGEVVGRVTDGATGGAVAGVTVRVDSLRMGAIAGGDGRFVIRRMPQGAYEVRVTAVGYAEERRSVVVPAEGMVRMDVLLTSEAIREKQVDVTASRGSDPGREPAFVTVLDSSWFSGRVTSVAEVLASTVGVKVRRLGGLGSYSTISVRGSTSEQVTVYLDGIPLNTALGGGVDLSTLPLSNIVEMEVHRGTSSSGSAMGGTVYIRTLETDTVSSQAGTVSWGSFDTRGVSAVVKGYRSRNRFLLIADHTSSDSDFSFLDDNGTEYNLADDESAARRNSDFSSMGLLGKWERPVGETARVFAQGNAYRSRQGIPGISNNQSLKARLNLFRWMAEVGVRTPAVGRYSVENRLTVTRKTEHFVDRLGEVGVGQQDNRYETTTAGWHGSVSTVMGDRMRPSLETDVRWERFVPASELQTTASLLASRRLSGETRGSLDVMMPHSVLVLWGGVQGLRSEVDEANSLRVGRASVDTVRSHRLGVLGVGLRVDLAEGLLAKANVGRSHRAPSFYEMFGDRGGVSGNKDLTPERGITWDAGFRYQRPGRTVLEAVYFDHRYRDLIQFAQVSQGTSKPFNFGSATVRGMELTVQATPAQRLRLSANYTLQLSTDRSDVPHWQGNRLPGRSVHEADVDIRAGWRRAEAFYGYSFEAGTFLDRANLRPVDDRHVHDTGIRLAIAERLRATFEIKNLFNNRVSDVWGYPLPGRAFFILMKESF